MPASFPCSPSFFFSSSASHPDLHSFPTRRSSVLRRLLQRRDGDLRRVVHELPRQLHHPEGQRDRKSTRLNSSHQIISYAVFCLKKKRNDENLRKALSYLDSYTLQTVLSTCSDAVS